MGELSEYCQRAVDDARRLGATRWTDEDRTAITTMGDRYLQALLDDSASASVKTPHEDVALTFAW